MLHLVPILNRTVGIGQTVDSSILASASVYNQGMCRCRLQFTTEIEQSHEPEETNEISILKHHLKLVFLTHLHVQTLLIITGQ